MSVPLWATDFIGLPFAYNGRNPVEGLDCWGLVRWVYDKRLDIELPSYGDVEASALRKVARQMLHSRDIGPWSMVIDPKPYDVVLMRVFNGNIPAHVGVMVSDTHFLHMEDGSNSHAVDFKHVTVRERIIGFRRHEDVQ